MAISEKIAQIRKEYTQASLESEEVAPEPIDQFKKWFDEVLQADLPEPNAMTLATVSSIGQPSCRVVLLKGLTEEGFHFYSNYESRKARNMQTNPKVCLNFFWAELERQVRVEGFAEKLSEEKSASYFEQRPRGSQLGAWASPQSSKVDNRAFLEKRYQDFQEKYEGVPIPRPPHWGGYMVRPFRVEFWQGRASRLHDRIVYEREADSWKILRLAP